MNDWRNAADFPPPIDSIVDLSRDGRTRLDTICWTRYISLIAKTSGLWWRYADCEDPSTRAQETE